jgi:hypothetical protein
VELTEINELADDLLAKLRDTTSAADVRDLVFRLDGLYRGAQIKALLPVIVEQGPCGFKWKWNQGREQHYEVCTLEAGHGGTHHLNQVTGINKRKVDCTCIWMTRQAMSESNTLAGSHHDDTCPLYLRTFDQLPNAVKPISDRLHELTSNWKSSADSYESVAEASSTEEAFAVQLRACAACLEAVLMEGGI